MTERTTEECFAIIKDARNQLKSMPTSKASEATITGYMREFDRLVGESGREPAELWAAVCNTSSKRTYHRRVAALRHNLRLELEAALRRQDQHQRANDTPEWLQEIEYVASLLELAQLVEASRGKCPLENPEPRRSKRQALRGLPSEWREQVSQAMKTSKYHIAYLAAAVTGCRPDELERGIQTCINNGEITFTIVGSKVKELQGQPTRSIVYSLEESHALLDELAAYIQAHGTEMTIQVPSKVNFTSAIRRVGRLLWPRRHAEITPYCLRHAAANDFKVSLEREQISAALGHAVDATASMYGQHQMSRGGGLRPLAVRAARAIKPTLPLAGVTMTPLIAKQK
ncbi:site-specific integrase [Chromobacterium vaccinii]|uniref:site-specific integrase n=1 Tax=Chromobacterium vaccinii TaxID=1108595 RepID=UPI000B01B6DB|nr:site-specific integrase [Chromobacterium vaccinii]